jgi:hypothetical protein
MRPMRQRVGKLVAIGEIGGGEFRPKRVFGG